MISNKFTKLLKNKEQFLNNYIDNVRDRVYLKKPKGKAPLALYHLNNMFKIIDNSFVISIIYGRLLRIININNKLDNVESGVCLDLGRDLVKNYHYCLYKHNKSIYKYNTNYTMWDWEKENVDP